MAVEPLTGTPIDGWDRVLAEGPNPGHRDPRSPDRH